MGTWFTSFFDNQNEIACDVRNEYIDYLQAGVTGRSATKQILDGFADEIKDSEKDGPVFWMALAVTQWKYGRLEPRVKAKALKIIQNGGDLAAYPPERQERRRKVLEKVRAQLESPQPPEKPVQVLKPAKPLKKIEPHWQPGQVVAFRRASGRLVLLLTEVVARHPYFGQIPYFVVLNWEGAKLPAPARILKLRATDCVISVYANKKGPPIPWDRVQKLDLVRDVTGIVRAVSGGVYCELGMRDGHWNELDSRLDEEFDTLPVKKG